MGQSERTPWSWSSAEVASSEPRAWQEGESAAFQDVVGTEARVGAGGTWALPPYPQAHRQRVLVVLICLSVAPSLSISVLTVSLPLNLASQGQVEPMATRYHFP